MHEDFEEIKSTYKGKKSDIIPLLQDIQIKYGYLPGEMMQEVSRFVGVSKSEVFGVATFYSQFRFTPKGRTHVMVCKGTACHVSGADKIIEGIERHLGVKEGDVTFDMEYSLESVGCLGCCALAPCAMVNDEIKSNISLKDVKRLFSKRKN
ncbi:MAG TPA: NADH-quinone oxidoreductase subunit NuoE [Methanobacterium sp.]|jgi:NADH-quinone oxidoreductase subunit E|nr:MAG: NADH-quinone oxidoreductase subunit NuoE [Methanobacterium sp.]HPX77509.1 NADH-quinone oxidoreductase subunit NuoE [Methanobacterium sp.]